MKTREVARRAWRHASTLRSKTRAADYRASAGLCCNRPHPIAEPGGTAQHAKTRWRKGRCICNYHNCNGCTSIVRGGQNRLVWVTNSRIVLGFLGAPAILLVALFVLFKDPVGLFVGVWVAYGCALVFGVPAFLIFRRFGWLAWWQVTLGGIGCLVPLLVFCIVTAPAAHLAAYGLSNSLVLASCSGTTAFCFWVIAIWRNRGLEPTASLIGQIEKG
jgi:hypothetical protein